MIVDIHPVMTVKTAVFPAHTMVPMWHVRKAYVIMMVKFTFWLDRFVNLLLISQKAFLLIYWFWHTIRTILFNVLLFWV